ncbi:MAG TPA: S49 family peptidase [Rhizobiales bacterium]|nr:S49 family peptidase [Hyphomicrobiales bacterium]
MTHKKSSPFSRLIPKRFRPSRVVIPVIKLHGAIMTSRGGLALSTLAPVLEKAFAKPSVKAVALSINSPGGSPVQSALIHDRIRQLAAKNNTQVLAFCDDVAASGGYWLATAGDEIYANAASIIGSIGVIAAGFGFVGTMEKIGVERRVYTAGKNKLILDPFQPEKKSDVARLKELQGDIHRQFIDHVRARRAGKLPEDEGELFTGAFWTGDKAKELGLIDGIGTLHGILEEKFGDGVEVKMLDRNLGLLGKLGLPRAMTRQFGEDLTGSILSGLEERALWQRYGL